MAVTYLFDAPKIELRLWRRRCMYIILPNVRTLSSVFFSFFLSFDPKHISNEKVALKELTIIGLKSAVVNTFV